jgi:hypothetical protein
MSRLTQFYRDNINGIIVTLLFHIVIFSCLYLSQFRIKNTIKETELIIDFSEFIPKPSLQLVQNENQSSNGEMLHSNIASNRLSRQQNNIVDEQYQNELEEAQSLLNDVKKQLDRQIPTIENLRMPDAPKANPEDMKDKIYSGESNIEYFLENRFHIKLPIPVYLAQGGGKVKVEIWVDRMGNVIKAEPAIEPSLSEQVLSYAKTAALRTKFNQSNDAPAQQRGYIIYTFIPQR